MNELKNKINRLKANALDLFLQIEHSNELETVRVQYLGRQGEIAQMMLLLKEASPDEKKVLGPLLNELKSAIQEAYNNAVARLKQQHAQQEQIASQTFDVTASYMSPFAGSLHPYTHITQELEDIFISMGYETVDGPELETDFHNFGALNIPEDHPARDMFDTFWLTIPGMLLRTHTSSVQIRTMEQRKPPLAIFASGRVYRNEATDASHDFMFLQGEALFIDTKVSIGHVIATAKAFLHALFDRSDLLIRVRPGYFPFVEPGFEIDVQCPFCHTGCSTCKKTTWIELLGAGLIHPAVLKAVHIDHLQYSGFAMGFGITRLAQLKYGIADCRLFHSTKTTFLKQF